MCDEVTEAHTTHVTDRALPDVFMGVLWKHYETCGGTSGVPIVSEWLTIGVATYPGPG